MDSKLLVQIMKSSSTMEPTCPVIRDPLPSLSWHYLFSDSWCPNSNWIEQVFTPLFLSLGTRPRLQSIFESCCFVEGHGFSNVEKVHRVESNTRFAHCNPCPLQSMSIFSIAVNLPPSIIMTSTRDLFAIRCLSYSFPRSNPAMVTSMHVSL